MSLKAKKLSCCVLCLLVLLLVFLPTYSALCDTATHPNAPFGAEKMYYNPLANSTVTYNAPSNSNLSSYSHDLPSALGGIIDSGMSNNNEPSDRHQYIGNANQVHPSVLDYAIFRSDGSGYTRLFNRVSNIDYGSLGVISYNIGYVLLADVDALLTYQFEVLRGYFEVRCSFTLQRDKEGVTDYYATSRLLHSEFIAPNEYPLLQHYGAVTENTYVRFNLAQLFALAYYGNNQLDDYYKHFDYGTLLGNVVSATIDIVPIRELAVLEARTIYNTINLTKCREYHATRSIYNDLFVSSGSPVIKLFQPIQAFLSIEFFPGFSFGYLLLIVIGVSFFTLMIKVLKSS